MHKYVLCLHKLVVNISPCNFLIKLFYVTLAIVILFFFSSLIHPIHSGTKSIRKKKQAYVRGRMWRRIGRFTD